MSDPSQSTSTQIIGALGTVIGYLGAEASTDEIFERLLWPQRFFHPHLSHDLWLAAFFLPMGGPLHRGALQALDKLGLNGLFEGADRGKMLGTVFFKDTAAVYSRVGSAFDGGAPRDARNAMWIRVSDALGQEMPLEASATEKTSTDQAPIRTRLAVNVFKLRYASRKEIDPNLLAREDHHVLGPTLLLVLWTEITGLAIAAIVFGVFRSMLGFLWIAPVILKIVAAMCHLHREGIKAPARDHRSQPTIIQFETKGRDFVLLEGDKFLLHQFSTHYGHPIRCRWKEVLLLASIVLFGLNFFVGLVLSIVKMPPPIQYVWLGYQLYATFALFIYRYGGGSKWLTTEFHLARKLAESAIDGAAVAFFGSSGGPIIRIDLMRVMASSILEAREIVKNMTVEPEQV